MGKFVDRERKEEIMYVAMEANLGAHVTNALYNNIFNNNLHVYNKILREDFANKNLPTYRVTAHTGS